MKAARRPDLTLDAKRFAAGETFHFAGLDLRIVRGTKQVDDLVLEWCTPYGWQKVPMTALFLMVDFLYENEHRIYPPRMGNLGGEYLLIRLSYAVRHGWEKAAAQLNLERTNRRAKGDRRESA